MDRRNECGDDGVKIDLGLMPSPSRFAARRFAGPSLSHGFAAGEGKRATTIASVSLSRARNAQVGEGWGEGSRGGALGSRVA